MEYKKAYGAADHSSHSVTLLMDKVLASGEARSQADLFRIVSERLADKEPVKKPTTKPDKSPLLKKPEQVRIPSIKPLVKPKAFEHLQQKPLGTRIKPAGTGGVTNKPQTKPFEHLRRTN